MKTEYFTPDHVAEITGIEEKLIDSFRVAARDEENGKFKKGDLVVSHYKDQKSDDLLTSVVSAEKLRRAFLFAPSRQIAEETKPQKSKRWQVAGVGVITTKGIVM